VSGTALKISWRKITVCKLLDPLTVYPTHTFKENVAAPMTQWAIENLNKLWYSPQTIAKAYCCSGTTYRT